LGAGLLSLPLLKPSSPLNAADHRDAPAIAEDGRADILDVYAFVNPNNSNVVLALTVNPFTIGGALQVAFSPEATYDFKIDNTGDYKEDLVIRGSFSPTVPGPQMLTVTALPEGKDKPAGHKKGMDRFSGPADGSVIAGPEGVRAFAGLRDDPFFIDLIWVLRLIGAQPGGPITNRVGGIDFFAGLNASVLAVEVPPAMLRGETGDRIRVWASTSREDKLNRSAKTSKADKTSGRLTQVDRTGLPVINTVLIPPPLKDAFNRTQPKDDARLFRTTAAASLFALNADQAYSEAVAAALLPDVLTLDVTKTDSFVNGFFNGRRPETDVIDAVLSVATKGAVPTDNVSANDLPFLGDFPFFAPPHAASEPIPGRN
jgi:hypothetical protein